MSRLWTVIHATLNATCRNHEGFCSPTFSRLGEPRYPVYSGFVDTALKTYSITILRAPGTSRFHLRLFTTCFGVPSLLSLSSLYVPGGQGLRIFRQSCILKVCIIDCDLSGELVVCSSENCNDFGCYIVVTVVRSLGLCVVQVADDFCLLVFNWVCVFFDEGVIFFDRYLIFDFVLPLLILRKLFVPFDRYLYVPRLSLFFFVCETIYMRLVSLVF